jgi:hypothetical protein
MRLRLWLEWAWRVAVLALLIASYALLKHHDYEVAAWHTMHYEASQR